MGGEYRPAGAKAQKASDSGVPAGVQQGEDGGLTLPDGRDPLSALGMSHLGPRTVTDLTGLSENREMTDTWEAQRTGPKTEQTLSASPTFLSLLPLSSSWSNS